MSHSLSQADFLAQVASRNPHQPEFIQAVSEVIASNNITVPEDFDIPQVSEEQIQEMLKKQQQQQQMPPMNPEGELEMEPGEAPAANSANSAANTAPKTAPKKK